MAPGPYVDNLLREGLSQEDLDAARKQAVRDSVEPDLTPPAESRDFSGARRLLTALIACCVLAPAVSLWALQAGNLVSQVRAIFCVVLFAVALLQIPQFLTAATATRPKPRIRHTLDRIVTIVTWLAFGLIVVQPLTKLTFQALHRSREFLIP